MRIVNKNARIQLKRDRQTEKIQCLESNKTGFVHCLKVVSTHKILFVFFYMVKR